MSQLQKHICNFDKPILFQHVDWLYKILKDEVSEKQLLGRVSGNHQTGAETPEHIIPLHNLFRESEGRVPGWLGWPWY